jgi:hypothetical protein
MKRYRSVKLDTDISMEDEILLDDEDEITLSSDEDIPEEAPEVYDIDETSEE